MVLGCIICKLFLAISVTKILLVTRFSWIFPQDPGKLGKIILLIATIAAILPNAAVCCYKTVRCQITSNTMAYLAGVTNCHQGVSFYQIYLVFWALMSGFALVLALFYIPYYLEVHVTSQAIQTGESNGIKKEINLKRILLGFCGFIFHLLIGVTVSYAGGDKGLPLNGYTSTASLNMMLIFFILDDGVWNFVKSYLPDKIYFLPAFIRHMKVNPVPLHGRV
jgi:hypothetical protein